MQRITEPWRRRYKGLKLYKDDLDALIKAAISERDQSDLRKKATIRVGEYVLDTASEVSELPGETADQLTIAIGRGLWLNLGPGFTYLQVTDTDDTEMMAIAGKMDAILHKRESNLSFACDIALFSLPHVVGMLFGFMIMMWGLIGSHGVWQTTLWGSTGALMIISSALLTRCRKVRCVRIILSYSHEQDSFFKRNKDAILVNLISGSAGVVLGIVGTLLVQWLTGKQ